MARGRGGIKEGFLEWSLDRFGQAPADYLLQFGLHLAAGAAVETSDLGKVLLNPQMPWLKLASDLLPEVLGPRCVHAISEREKLSELFCVLLEVTLMDDLGVLLRHKPDDSAFRLAAQGVVGGLTQHMVIYLPGGACDRDGEKNGALPLLTSVGNDYRIFVAGKTYIFRGDMGIAQATEAVKQLGDAFLMAYVNSYVRLETLRKAFNRLFKRLNPQSHGKDVLAPYWTKVDRSIQKYAKSYRERLGAYIILACRQAGLLDASSQTGQAAPGNELALWPVSTPALFPALAGQVNGEQEIDFSAVELLIARLQAARQPGIEFPGVLDGEQRVSTGIASSVEHIPAGPAGTEPEFSFSQEAERLFLIRLSPYQRQILYGDILAAGANPAANEDRLLMFVAPRLEYFDCKTLQKSEIVWTQLCNSGYRCLLTAPPNGGKWRLQREVARRMAASGATVNLFVDLQKFSQSGLLEVYRYAADELVRIVGPSTLTISDWINQLHELDSRSRIVWHLENWDAVPDEARPRLVQALKPLRSCLLSTADAYHARLLLEGDKSSNGLDGIVEIKPFDAVQIQEFVEQYIELHECENEGVIPRLVAMVPRLASAPGGLEHICSYAHRPATLIELLLDFVNHDLAEAGVLAEETLSAREVRLTLGIVSRLPRETRGVPLATLARIDPADVLRQLDRSTPDAQRVVAEAFEAALRGRLLQANDDGQTYRFTIPEVGYLFRAMDIYNGWFPLAGLRAALDEQGRLADGNFTEMDLAYAAYLAEQASWPRPADA